MCVNNVESLRVNEIQYKECGGVRTVTPLFVVGGVRTGKFGVTIEM